MQRLVAVLLIAAAGAPLHAAVLTVDDDGPADYNNIKAAVTVASPGDTIVLADGTYTGPGNRGIDFNGKTLTLRSLNGPGRCVIDCENKDRGFYFHRTESQATLLEGITILGGWASYGGAVYCTDQASPTLRNCILRDNCATVYGGALAGDYETSPTIERCLIYANVGQSAGGGIYSSNGSLTLTDCTISRNTSGGDAGGLYFYDSRVNANRCTFAGNSAQSEGGAVAFHDASPMFTNCVFIDNASYTAGAMYCAYGTSTLAVNCTFRGNTAAYRAGGILCSSDATCSLVNSVLASHTQHAAVTEWGATVTFVSCLFNDNLPGDVSNEQTSTVSTGGDQINGLSTLNAGNFSGDPRFALAGSARLLGDSPCIDHGSNDAVQSLPATDLDGNPRIVDGDTNGAAAVDVGAFEHDPARPALALSPVAIEFVREADGTGPAPAIVRIRNCGSGACDWRLEGNCPWLTFEPSAGTVAADTDEVTLSVGGDDMPQGIHQALLIVRSPGAANGEQTILATLRVKGTRHVPDGYSTIQAAIDAAMDGETIEVGPGTYRESLRLTKKLKLVGIDRPVIDANTPQLGTAVTLAANGCIVDGFRIIARAVGLSVQSSNNLIANNCVTAGTSGIVVESQRSGNALLDNEIVGCAGGLSLRSSPHNTLRGNAIHGNIVNFEVLVSSDLDYENDIDTSNTVDGKPLYYLIGKSNVVIDKASDAGCVMAINCSNLAVSDVTLTHNSHGVLFVNTTGSRIERVTATDNSTAGILLQNSSTNTLVGNTTARCRYGIYLTQGTGNTLQNNTMTGNRYNFSCYGSSTTNYEHTVATSNTVDGKPIFYLVGAKKAGINFSTRAGCVFAINCSGILVQDLTFENNGTGVVFVNTTDSTIENVIVADNEQTGIVLRSCTNVAVRASAVSGSTDGVAAQASTNVAIESSDISRNRRGIWSTQSTLDVTNCHVHANAGTGGIVFDYSVQADILNCTICGNSGSSDYYYGYSNPSGVVCGYLDRPVTIANSILWANQGGQISTPRGNRIPTVTYCDVQGGYEGEGNIDAPPMLTPDGHLCLGSPCIDKGPRRSGYAESDIDGEQRNARLGTDIGCDEYFDADTDGLPDWWESGYFENATAAAPDRDPDEDGHTNLAEYEVFASGPTVPATIYYVDAGRPDDSNDGLSWDTAKRTIQAAVDLAGDSDKIYIAPGLYTGNVTTTGRQIWIKGLDVEDDAVIADTVLSGLLSIARGESPGCVIAGLTITNKNGTGVLCSGSSPTLRNCRMTACRGSSWQHGGGITLIGASPQIVRCSITGNMSSRGAGLLCRSSSSPTLRQCLFTGNICNGDGQVIYAEQSDVRIENCTLADNVYSSDNTPYGSAIQCYKSQLFVTNSILWNRLPLQVQSDELPATVTYSDVYGANEAIQHLASGVGNISVDPCFVAAGFWNQYPYFNDARWVDGDYHLRSAGWRWTPFITHGTNWVWDGQTSRCIDAGNPACALGDEVLSVLTDPDGEWGENLRINLGAYGGTREASMAPPGWALLCDIDNDGVVNLRDFNRLAGMNEAVGANSVADVNRDSRVNGADLARLADDWLRETAWPR